VRHSRSRSIVRRVPEQRRRAVGAPPQNSSPSPSSARKGCRRSKSPLRAEAQPPPQEIVASPGPVGAPPRQQQGHGGSQAATADDASQAAAAMNGAGKPQSKRKPSRPAGAKETKNGKAILTLPKALSDGTVADQIEVANNSGHLSPADRAAAVRFFDGAGARSLLLEGGAVARVPDYLVPLFLNGFPHGFQELSQEGAMQLLEVLTAFTSHGGNQAPSVSGAERSAEVRQTLIVGARGRRSLRKALVINGVELCSEERVL